jgi:hypothetical protein
MKIELKDGTLIHVDDQVELRNALTVVTELGLGIKRNPPKSNSTSDDLADNEMERVRAFFKSINPNARKFLFLLIAHKEGVRGTQFAQMSGFSVNKFGGIMGGMEKMAKHQKLKGEQFIQSTQRISGTARYRWLSPGRLLLKYEMELQKIRKEDTGEIEAVSMGA